MMLMLFMVGVILASWSTAQTYAVSPCSGLSQGRFPHPDYCQAYYDCGVSGGAPGLEPNMLECTYPQLYNTALQLCDDFANVICGTRPEFVKGCDYLANQCYGPHCRPCILDFQDCSGRPDGSAPSFRPRHYIKCKAGRFMGEAMCPPDAHGVPMMFDIKSNMCKKEEDKD